MVNLSHPLAWALCLPCAAILKACYHIWPCKKKKREKEKEKKNTPHIPPFIMQTQRRAKQNSA